MTDHANVICGIVMAVVYSMLSIAPNGRLH